MVVVKSSAEVEEYGFHFQDSCSFGILVGAKLMESFSVFWFSHLHVAGFFGPSPTFFS